MMRCSERGGHGGALQLKAARWLRLRFPGERHSQGRFQGPNSEVKMHSGRAYHPVEPPKHLTRFNSTWGRSLGVL